MKRGLLSLIVDYGLPKKFRVILTKNGEILTKWSSSFWVWPPLPRTLPDPFPQLLLSHSCTTPLCSDASTHGRLGWKARPLTRLDLVSNLVSILPGPASARAARACERSGGRAERRALQGAEERCGHGRRQAGPCRARAPRWTMQLLSARPRDGGRPGMGVVSRSRTASSRALCAASLRVGQHLWRPKHTSELCLL